MVSNIRSSTMLKLVFLAGVVAVTREGVAALGVGAATYPEIAGVVEPVVA
jgi:hypothetical protein